jgi:hypothetical protein
MERFNVLVVTFIKGIALLVGIFMLIGGGICSAALSFSALSENALSQTSITLAMILVFIGLLWVAVTLPFQKQRNGLLLLTGVLFLVGGGLCGISSNGGRGEDKFSYLGLVFLNIAVFFLGYFLIRWIFAKKSKTLD